MPDLPEHPGDPEGMTRCGNCDTELTRDTDAAGRPRRWCSDYCRNAGYVAERELEAMTLGAHEVVCGQCFLVHRPEQECP